MDDRRFDDLTKAFTSLTPRRAVVRLLAGGAIGGALAAVAFVAPPARRARAMHECDPRDLCCRYCEKPDPPLEPGTCIFTEGEGGGSYTGCCPSGNARCGGSPCCPQGYTCIPPDPDSQILPGGGCCPLGQPILCGRNCCRTTDSCCGDGSCCAPPYQCEGATCKPPCPAGKFRCGEWGCCDNGKICDNGVCKTCPDGAISCGGQCCGAGQVARGPEYPRQS